MAISIREVVTDVAISTTASVSTGAGTLPTDLLLAVGMSEFYNLASEAFGPPTGGGWTVQATAELAGDNTKIRLWTKTAPGGATQVDLDPMIDEGIALAVLVLEGADLGAPVEDADGAASSAATPSVHVAPSIDPTSTDALLLCAAASAVFGGVAAYTPPGGMAEQYEVGTAGGGSATFTAAVEQLAAAGATGTRSFGFANNGVAGVALAVAVKTGAPIITPSKVADRGSAQNLTSSQSTAVDLPDGGDIAVGNVLIARLAMDNTGGGGQATTVSISDPRGNTWTVGAAANQDPGAAAAGVSCRIAYCVVENAYTDGDDLTVEFGNNTAADSTVVEEWANIDTVAPVAVAQVTNAGASATPSVAITPTAADQLVYAAIGIEGPAGDTYTQDTDTTDGAWSGLTSLSTTSGTAAANATVRGASKLVTTAGTPAEQTWNPGITSRDWAAVAIVFAPAPGVIMGAVGQVVDTSTARTVTARKAAAAGQVATAETARPVTARKAAAAGQVASVETARPFTVTGPQVIPVGQAVEDGIAGVVGTAKAALVGQVNEAEGAQFVGVAKTATVGAATTADQPRPVGADKTTTAGQVTAVDTAHPLAAVRSHHVELAGQADAARPVTAAGTLAGTVSGVVDTATAQPVVWAPKARLITLAVDASTAALLTLVSSPSIAVITPGILTPAGTQPTLTPAGSSPALATAGTSPTLLTGGQP
jgi:hypothetical protein